MNRSIRRIYLAFTAAFLALILLLGYWQVVAADDLNDRPQNPQALQREKRIDRGTITTSDGIMLAESASKKVAGQTEFSRTYVNGALAPHVVGYSSSLEGKTGIESEYNRFLAGSFGDQPILERLRRETKRGANLTLTIDSRIQQAAVDALSGQRGAIVALEPSTGAVLAMASAPAFDLSDVETDFEAIRTGDGSPLLNRATQGRYAPGSTFKVVATTAALASGQFLPTTRFDDTGSFDTPGGPIRNFGGSTYGDHNLIEALTRSINTTFARIGTTLGPSGMGNAMDGFGFGEVPPIDLPSDQVVASGRYEGGKLLPNDEAGIDTARLAIGQERLAVTPLQMALVASAIANRGTMPQPFVVQSVVDRSGDVVYEARVSDLNQSASAEVADQVGEMMTRVVLEGTGVAAALQGLSVAGKTGTAETADEGRNQAWFIGFAPSEDPIAAISVVIEDTSGTGGSVAAPAFADVMRAAVTAKG
ncbi:MAG: penicillin-binding protein 2 [Thermoleophilia bacterium]|nr:penicillin-binding protein 2 [Thermoleophilia bacterium]